ncbi:MAG: UDP-N-acetylmuramate--L-alanine ligase [Gammaproteobacteria bacterium]|nr:UDP-N-acetylmuramate--L-alanine ligase [Gammaproteobacteria bacterium]
MNKRMRKINRIHLVGIGGVGMAGIAEVLINLGYQVQGSDLKESKVTNRLAGLGADISIGHRSSNIEDADLIVVSSAIDPENNEIIAAREQRLPIIRRAEMLAELMRFRFAIAVSGTHGKTTTTSLIASMLAEAGEDPTFLIGGWLKSADTNSRLGAGDYIVAEADESDASFIHLKPMMVVVTNIDADHMSTYNDDIEELRNSFLEFMHNLPFYGVSIMCLDDDGVQAVLPQVNRAVLSYGLHEDADVRAVDIKSDGVVSHFSVLRPNAAAPIEVKLNLPGRHNVLNALAAIAVGFELELDDDAVCRSLAEFQGIDRRMQIITDENTPLGQILFIDDYAHHPTEIAATLAAVQGGWPDRRLVVIFQPHRYSRTRDLLDDFAAVLSVAESLFVTEVYPAGEEPIPGADGRAICRAIRMRGQVEPVFVADPVQLPELLAATLTDGDIVLTLGAGDIGTVAAALPAAIAQAGKRRDAR